MVELTRPRVLSEVFGFLSALLVSILVSVRLRHSPRPTWRPALRPRGGCRSPLLAAGKRRKPPSEPPSGPPSSPPSPPSPPDDRATPPGTGASSQGDRAALLSLMRLYPMVLRILVRCGVPDGDVPDVAQNVIVTLLPMWPTLAIPPDKLEGSRRRAFVATVTLRFAWAYHQREQRRAAQRAHIEQAEIPDVVPSPEDIVLDREADAERAGDVVLAELRAATSPDFWRAFYAHDVEGVPASTIAKLEGLPVATVYNRLRRARRDLREAITRKRLRRSTDERNLLARRNRR